ncbi:MAG: phage tail protein [Cyanobacteria bacterium P01_A01_bin.80]
MFNFKKLFFSGGLFKKPKAQESTQSTNISDTKRSISKGQVIEIICSGGKYGIEGFFHGNEWGKSIYLDETPVLNENGTSNFEGIDIYYRGGAPGQTAISEFNSEIVNELPVSVDVNFNTPVTRAFVNENVSAIRIRLSFVLLKNQKDGNDNVTGTEGNDVIFKVYIREGNGAFIERQQIEMSGKFSQAYEKIWFFTVDESQSEFYIRIERITAADDEDSSRIIRWESYSIITETILPFKGCAFSGLRFNAEDFGQSIPERKYRINGQYLDIPSNSICTNDGGLDFTGNWDGFYRISDQACGDFGASVWYLLTDEIDGAGEEIKASMIDRFSLYQVSEYNNEYIPDGYGGVERRFLFNGVINQQDDTWKKIEQILSGCNTRYVWENDTIKFIQDRPEKPTATISNADVENGIFNYSTVDVTQIATACNVTWIEPITGKPRNAYYSDPTAISTYGYNLKQIEAVGCNRYSQAYRMAKSIVFNETTELNILTFSCRGWVSFLPVGSVIIISDSSLHSRKQSGLIKDVTSTSQITTDEPIQVNTLDGFDEQYYLLIYPDVREEIRKGNVTSAYEHYQIYGISEGRNQNGYLLGCLMSTFEIEFRNISNPIGVHTELYVDTPFTDSPEVNSTYIVISPDIPIKYYRIEGKDIDDSNPDMLNITCKEYNPYKWDNLERGLILGTQLSSVITADKPNTPTNFLSNSYNNSGNYRIEISWSVPLNNQGDRDNFISKYLVSYKLSTETSFSNEEEIDINSFELNVNTGGTYNFRIRAQTFNGLNSDYLYGSVII